MTKLNFNDEKLKEWMDDSVEKNKFNGCSLSIADTECNTLLDIASGHADKDKTKEFNSQSIVRIFSMTKAIVSTCLLQLTHDKKINLEEKVTMKGPGVLAFDGERDRVLHDDETIVVSVSKEGPWVINTHRALDLANIKKHFVSST